MGLFGTLGVRGIANKDLTPEMAEKLAAAYGSLIQGKIMIGADARSSGDMLKSAIASGLLSSGCKVYDAGISPSPTIQWGVRHYGLDGGVVITASHNPAQYNGFKFTDSGGIWIKREMEQDIERAYETGNIPRKSWDEIHGINRITTLNSDFIKTVLDYVDYKCSNPIKVVVDCANSVGALTTPQILSKMGCKVLTLNAQIDGHFPGREPEPTEEHLSELMSTVVSTKSDLGIAHDGDADRCITISDKGDFIFGDTSFALVADHIFGEWRGGTAVMPVNTSDCVMDVIKNHGGKIVETKIGEVNIVRKLLELDEKRTFGGEENGGLIFPEFGCYRNGPLTSAIIVKLLDKANGKKYSDLLSELPQYEMAKDNLAFSKDIRSEIISKILKEFEGDLISDLDGAKIRIGNGWVLIRPSGTEPKIRIFAEGRSKEEASDILKQFKSKVNELAKELLK